jgi:hypothetical protein
LPKTCAAEKNHVGATLPDSCVVCVQKFGVTYDSVAEVEQGHDFTMELLRVVCRVFVLLLLECVDKHFA